MALVSDRFPKKYLAAADLKGKEIVATISHVTSDVFENDGQKAEKPIVHFQDAGLKPMVSNVTNHRMIAAIAGDDDAHWSGKQIALTSELVNVRGKVIDALRVRRPSGNAAPFNDSTKF